MPKDRSFNVFLSYSKPDEDWATKLASTLREAGLRPWDARTGPSPGQDWKDQTEEALRDSETLVIVLGPKSMVAPSMYFELGAAIADRKRIVTVIREGADV